MVTGLRVSALAKCVGVSSDTIRYYERVGLLPPPERTAADYRSYDASAVDRMKFIQGAQRLGLRLNDIKTLLDVRDTGLCPCEPAETLLRQRIDEIDSEIVKLSALRHNLATMVEQLPDNCPQPSPGSWIPRGEGGDEDEL